MLLRYLLTVPAPLRSWPSRRPPTTQPRQLETQMRTCFRNAEASLLPFRSAEHALREASVYQTQRWEARFLCQLAQKWFYPPSLRAELVSESLGLGAWISSRASSERLGDESTPRYSAAILVSPSGCAANHEGGGSDKIPGVSRYCPKLWKKRLILTEAVICVFD